MCLRLCSIQAPPTWGSRVLEVLSLTLLDEETGLGRALEVSLGQAWKRAQPPREKTAWGTEGL